VTSSWFLIHTELRFTVSHTSDLSLSSLNIDRNKLSLVLSVKKRENFTLPKLQDVQLFPRLHLPTIKQYSPGMINSGVICIEAEKYKQCMYYVTPRRVSINTGAVKKPYYIFWACVCSLNHTACCAHVPYDVIRGLSGRTIFLHIMS